MISLPGLYATPYDFIKYIFDEHSEFLQVIAYPDPACKK